MKFKRSLGVGIVQPLKCILNSVRFDCTYTVASGYIDIIINVALINAFVPITLNEMTLSTEFVSPDEGFLHPSLPGYYGFDITVTDVSNNKLKSTRFM